MSEGITASFTKRFAAGPVIRVEGLRLSAHAGITVLFGASGSGKTTVLRCLAGLERPEEGVIKFGNEIWSDAAQDIFLRPQQRRVGFVPQDYALFPHLSVEGNVAYGLNELPTTERGNRIAETLRWLELVGFERRRLNELSGGQQQRVALARAVVRGPRLLLLDEPLAALDSPTRLRLRGELRRLLMQANIPTLLVTHDRLEALALGDELVVMDQGNVLQQGPVTEVFSRPASLAVAAIVAVETVQPGRVLSTADGLVTLQVGDATLTALAGDLPPGAGEVYACIRAEDVILIALEQNLSSARNHLSATIRAITREGPMMRIDLDCGFPLMALLTKQACEEMTLKPGDVVVALVKAPQIHVIPRSGLSLIPILLVAGSAGLGDQFEQSVNRRVVGGILQEFA